MIDDLVKYCLTEVAYEGELGCTIERLKELITRFSDTALSSSSLRPSTTDTQKTKQPKQNVDDAYCAYVYSIIAKHPSIVIGTVPDGTPPVWIAPAPHKKGQAPPPPPVSLNVIPKAEEKSMADLQNEYGTQLRIAVDKETCFVALTGSHNRPSRLSDTVYSTLQIITRAREKGIAVKDLGPITKYDPKSIFYQIAQLVDMNLVVKVSKGPSMNWAVLKKFYERSQLWQMIVGEKDAGPEGGDERENLGDEAKNADLVANVHLLRYRVLKLVERSTNQIHQYNNMIVSAGFTNPTKSQRRFFTSRLNEMIQEGLLEKIGIPTDRGTAICVKLTEKGKEILEKRNPESEEQMLEQPLINESVMEADIEDEEFAWTEDTRPSRGVGLQRQIISLLDANPGGLTIKELSATLGNFDRRTIEQVLARLCTRVPPRHLADLHPVTVMETEGKMRRQRYFTIKHYRQLLEEQNLPDDRYNWLHMDDVGKYAHVDEAAFWKTPADITQYLIQIQEERGKKAKDSAKQSAAKKKVYKNPVINGVPKRGRPRKDAVVVEGEASAAPKTEKKRPPKRKAIELETINEEGEGLPNPTEVSPDQDSALPVGKPTKSRKRKKKDVPTSDPLVEAVVEEDQENDMPEPDDQTVPDADIPSEIQGISETLASIKASIALDIPVSTRSKTGAKKGKKRAIAEVADTGVLMPPKKKQKTSSTALSPERGSQIARTADDVEPPPQGSENIIPEPVQDSQPVVEPIRTDVEPATEIISPKSPLRPHRRPKQQKPRATNVSELRRQQEIMDVLLANDGIMQLNTEMAIHLRDHVQELAESGIQTGQGAGFLSDKKTIGRTVSALEEKGRVKVLKTVILDPNRKGTLQQPTTIIYLPETSQEKLQVFLVSLQKPYKPTIQLSSTPLPVTEVIEYSKSTRRTVLTSQDEDINPPGMSAADIAGPRQQFLEDRQTVAQLFGFLLGKSRRAQELYLFTLSHILSDSPSPTVISVQERIVSTTYWTEDYPLGSFCAVIPTQVYIPYLEAAQNDPNALNEPLKSLNPALRRALGVKHARTRLRLMEIFVVLRSLQLITPLKESPDGTIIATDTGDGGPRSFAEVEATLGANSTPPAFWRFNQQVPLWLFVLAKFTSQHIETEPPFYKDLTISTLDDAVAYWSLLQRVCDRQTDFAAFDVGSNPSKPLSIPPAVLTSLCHFRGWTADYRLSKLQEEYLKDMVDVNTLTTPLNDPTPDRLMQAAFITCAPQQVICNYFAKRAAKLETAFERIERKKQKATGAIPPNDALQRSLAQKAEQHLQDVGAKWDRLVKGIVGDELSSENAEKLRPLRGRYIMVGGIVDEEKLRDLVENVIRNPVESVRKRYQKTSSKFTSNLPPEIQMEHIEEAMPQLDRIFRPFVAQVRTPLLPVDANGFPPLPPALFHQATRPVADIIESMGAAPEDEAPRPKRGKASSVNAEGTSEGKKGNGARRKRFHWNEEYEELLHDTVAIIRARCREKGHGIRWQPAEKVFPPVRANNLRTHFNKYVAQPGAANYMDRLERGWYALWQVHKGRPELPLADPSDTDGSDIIAHVEFLRKYLDKRKLLSNIERVEESSISVANSQFELPNDINSISTYFRVEEQGQPAMESILQQYWGDLPAYLNERSHTVSATAFTEKQTPIPDAPILEQSVAESVIQIIVATEHERYSEEVATALLLPFGEETIKHATNSLWKRGTISKIPKTKVGRGYRMSESNADDITGKFPVQRIEDAAALETVFQEDPDEWRSWSINASEGEMAALLWRASKHEAEFKIQIPDLKMARDIAQWTSRKIQDEMLETRLEVLFTQPDEDTTTPSENDTELSKDQDAHENNATLGDTANSAVSMHGKTYDGKAASCLIVHGAGELVNCVECLKSAQESLLAQHPMLEANILGLLERLETMGKHGMFAEDVWDSSEYSLAAPSVISCVPPLAFWSGYTRSCLVASRCLGSYAVWLRDRGAEGNDGNSHLVIPRRWIDLNHNTVSDTWKSALRAVVGLLLTKPLADHFGLIRHFHKVYDRLDILAVLEHLQEKGVIRMVDTSPSRESARKLGQMTVEEEARTLWELEKGFEWHMLL